MKTRGRGIRARLLGLALGACLASTAASASVIYVNAGATGANNGTSWANAFTSLQSGLAAAGSGDEIWVVAATYKPTTTTDRTISFVLKNNVGVYGGFNGTETQRPNNPNTRGQMAVFLTKTFDLP